MNNKILVAAGAVLGLMVSLSAHATYVGFVGPFAPATWTTTIVGQVDGGGAANGSINTAGAPSSITLNGGDDPNISGGCQQGFLACEIQFSHVTGGVLPISFHWSYNSSDSAGAQLDQFGYLLDGVHHDLSDPGGAVPQQGDVLIQAGNSFGFYINCGDCTSGNAVVTIDQFVAPEPASMALVGLGLLGMGALRRKKAGT